MKNLSLLILIFLFISNAEAKKISQTQCEQKKDNFIFVQGECINYILAQGDKENHLNILVHGTWKKGTNILGRYAPLIEDIAMNTDISTLAIALPGYSKSSSNYFKDLQSNKHQAYEKDYLEFVSQILEKFKKKYKVNNLHYIGHSAGASMGMTISIYKKDLITSMISIGAIYNIHKQTSKKNLYSVSDYIKEINHKKKYLLIYGEKDKISKAQETKDFYKRVKKRNIDVQIIEVKNAVHLDLEMTDTSLDAISDFLE